MPFSSSTASIPSQLKWRVVISFVLAAVMTCSNLLEASTQQSRKQDVWRDASRCGINSLYLLLRAHSVSVDYDEVLARCPPRLEAGVSLADIQNTATDYGFPTVVVKLNEKSLVNVLPAIVHLESDLSKQGSLLERGHFSLATEINAEQVRLIDGTSGVAHSLSRTDFLRRWTGYAITSSPPSHAWLLPITILHCAMWLVVNSWLGQRKRQTKPSSA